MQRSNLGVTGAFIALLCSAIAPATATAQAVSPPNQVYTVSPNPGPADQAFTLYLNGGAWSSCTFFTHETLSVVGKRIDLAFTENTSGGPVILNGLPAASPAADAIVCPVAATAKTSAATPIILPISPSPSFNMPALAAGTYEVYATSVPACAFSTPRCLIATMPQYAGTLTIAPEPAVTYTFTPTSVDAGKAFDLHLLSYAFNCGTTYDNLNVAVNGNTISLTFQDHADMTGVICPAIYAPYGPTFAIPALKAGSYTVQAIRLPACAPLCKIAVIPVDAGTLTVRDPGRKGWFIDPKTVVSGLDFKLNLLNNALGNCGTTFVDPSISVAGNQIWAKFYVQLDSNIRCIQDIIPFGPSFDMKGLAPGSYPVLVTEYLHCQIVPPLCPVANIIPAPSDTLVVTKTTAILTHGGQDYGAAARQVAAEFHGSNLSVTLPDGPRGLWRAELIDVRGNLLGAFADQAEGGQTLSLSAKVAAQRGLYLLRLRSPSGETRTLPLVRKD